MVQQVLAVSELPIQLLVQDGVHMSISCLWQVIFNVLLDVLALLLQCEQPELLLLCLNKLGFFSIKLSHLDLKALLQGETYGAARVRTLLTHDIQRLGTLYQAMARQVLLNRVC